MASVKERLQGRTWTRDGYLISTDHRLVDIDALIEAWGTDEVYWANPMPPDAMKEMLQNSLSFGLYEVPASHNDSDITKNANSSSTKPHFIGLARCVTDFTTFSYLTDVWISPKHQGLGLGKWLVRCVDEVIREMPHLRRSVLFTGNWEKSVPFYKDIMGMDVVEGAYGEGLALMMWKGRGHPDRWDEKEV